MRLLVQVVFVREATYNLHRHIPALKADSLKNNQGDGSLQVCLWGHTSLESDWDMPCEGSDHWGCFMVSIRIVVLPAVCHSSIPLKMSSLSKWGYKILSQPQHARVHELGACRLRDDLSCIGSSTYKIPLAQTWWHNCVFTFHTASLTGPAPLWSHPLPQLSMWNNPTKQVNASGHSLDGLDY